MDHRLHKCHVEIQIWSIARLETYNTDYFRVTNAAAPSLPFTRRNEIDAAIYAGVKSATTPTDMQTVHAQQKLYRRRHSASRNVHG